MASLLDCSHELLHSILVHVEPANLAALSQTCWSLHAFVQGNALLCKELYLQRWDYPCGTIGIEPDWQSELQSLVKLEKVLWSRDMDHKRDSLAFAAPIIANLILTSDPRKNIDYLSTAFESQDNVDAFLTRSSLYSHGGSDRQTPAPTSELRQAAARLHCYYGIPIDYPLHGCTRTSIGAHTRSPYPILHPGSDAPHGRVLRSSHRVGIAPNNIARARVYDLREYTMASRWGPFKLDGSLEVDWEKMEAIMVLLTFNLQLCCSRLSGVVPTFCKSWEGVGRNSFRDNAPGFEGSITGMFSSLRSSAVSTMPEIAGFDLRNDKEKEAAAIQAKLDKEDPFGVTRTWMRIVCFLDYNDLYAFNFTRSREQQESTRGIDTREAIRLIRLRTKVTKIVYPARDREEDGDSSSDFDDDKVEVRRRRFSNKRPLHANDGENGKGPLEYSDWPIVHFQGHSRSLHANWDPNANSSIRGQVQMTRHGDVRWTTWSIFHGEERWRSEGVQVGGPNSARGVLGNWFDKDYERQGPAGPTAFWKISSAMLDDVDEDDHGHAGPILHPLWHAMGEDEVSEDGEEVEVEMGVSDSDNDAEGDSEDEVEEDGEDEDEGLHDQDDNAEQSMTSNENDNVKTNDNDDDDDVDVDDNDQDEEDGNYDNDENNHDFIEGQGH